MAPAHASPRVCGLSRDAVVGVRRVPLLPPVAAARL